MGNESGEPVTIGDGLRLDGRRVVLTGATGFIGARVLAALVSAGAEVQAVVRSARGAAAVEAAGAWPATVRLTDPAAMRRVLDGAEALVHFAYDIRAGAGPNLAVFRTLLDAAVDTGTARIVHASSVVVYDGWPDRDIDETAPISRPGGGAYREAKIAMEERLMQGPLPAAILQPTIVYGPRSGQWTDRLAGALAGGGYVLPEPDGICNAVHVDDVARAALCALALEDLGRERFLISGPEPVRWHQLLEGYAAIVGGALRREPVEAIRARLGPPPQPSAGPSLAARVSSAGRRLLGHERFEALVARARGAKPGGDTGPAYPDHHLLAEMTGGGRVSIGRARARLGYEPMHDLASGLAATAPYLRATFGSAA